MAALKLAIESANFRKVLGHYPTGVCVIAARDASGLSSAMVVGSFVSVSLDPPLVGFFSDRSSTSWPRIRNAGKFCVNVLASDQGDVCTRLAAKAEDKFSGTPHRFSGNGSPILDDVIAWIDCDLHAIHEAGDHFFILGEVCELDIVRAEQPLLFCRGEYGNFAPLRRS